MNAWKNCLSVGSSPLARGALQDFLLRGRTVGLIPARAGSTRVCRASWCRAWAHPRSRGEHVHGDVLVAVDPGSSPLARGARHRRRAQQGEGGLIPARAGSTGTTRSGSSSRWAHPRSRGEHALDRSTHWAPYGSSPLARGAHRRARPARQPRGLIPARAGSTGLQVHDQGPSGAHPRSRGEHAFEGGAFGCGAGSSPLARGAPHPEHARRCDERLIPARAGSTRHRTRCPGGPRAHPRSRGEHKPGTPEFAHRLGSSPLARGARSRAGSSPGCGGLIPARAGSTLENWPNH